MKKIILISSMVIFYLLTNQSTASAEYSNYLGDYNTQELPSEH